MDTILEFVFFLGFIYWAFPNIFSNGLSRINKMVDLVTTRLFDTFNRFSPKENRQNEESLCTIGQLKRFTREQENLRRSLFKQDAVKVRDNHLFDIKENIPHVEMPRRRPLMGFSCDYCTTASRQSLANKATEHFALQNMLHFWPKTPRNFLQRTFTHLYNIYDLKEYDFIQVDRTVMNDDYLKRAIEMTALQQFKYSNNSDPELYEEFLRNHQKRAQNVLHDMRSTISNFLLKFTSWVLFKLFPCFLSGIVVHPGQIKMLEEASKSSLPLIFLPLHRSHLDYILLSLILLNNNIRPPLVAGGDNLRIPVFGSLLRGLGAFFIKRRIDPIMGQKDHVYKAVLHTYMNECLRAGHSIEFYLEGGRTRTGKPCMPKYGLLSVIVQAFMDGTVEDALLVPVSINYEKLVDGNFIREQLGQPKQMESFTGAIKGIWRTLNSDYGMMRMDFNQPFSLRELVRTFNINTETPMNGYSKKLLKSKASTSSLYGTDIVADEHKNLVEYLSRHVIYDCAKSTTIMSTNAVAFLLLFQFRKGATIDELIDALDDMRKDLNYSRRDVGFSGDSMDVINNAIDLLGPGLVRKERINNQEIVKPIAILPNVIELSYYSNTLVTHFAIDSIIARCIHIVQDSGNVSHENLTDTVLELCNLLQYEFILCKPCQKLGHVIHSCIDDLNIKMDIFVAETEETELIRRSKQIAKTFDDDDDDDDDRGEPGKIYKLNSNENAMEFLKFLQTLIMPLIESYSVTAMVLEKLIGRTLLENELILEILEEIKLQINDGSLNYEECLSVDSIKNALKLFQKWDYLECHQESKLKLYYLREDHDNSDSIQQLYEKVNKFRL